MGASEEVSCDSAKSKSKSKSESLALSLLFTSLAVEVDRDSSSVISSSVIGVVLVAAGSLLSSCKSSRLSSKACSILSKSLEVSKVVLELSAKSLL